ncbi:hypothetical protein ACHAW5_009519 [Stephanodiscus triporus]|uniref:Uncharacterized protein n=1 Tax=Stephanodiscus triporus TaxID=2934178 RepID=A0ABD3NQI4_9STRA
MISCITCTTAILLVLAELNTTAAIRSNEYDKRHGLRKLYYSEGHEVTDVQTKCDQVIEGNPKRCMIVCVEVTSVKDGYELVDEYSKVSQRKCEAGWYDGHDGDNDDRKGHTEWPTYSPTTQFPTYYPTGLVDDGHHVDTKWAGDGHERVIDWTDDGWTSYSDESLVSEGSKGGKSGGYSKGSKSGHSKSSKSKGGYSKSSTSNGSKGGSYLKGSKEYYVGNFNGEEGSGYSKSYKSSGGDVGDWDATILESTLDEWEAASWSGGAGVIEGTGSSKSSKPDSDSWSSSAGTITGSGSSKSSKPESVSWSSSAVSSGKSSKRITESASWSGRVGGSNKSSKLESLGWSGGAGANKEGSGSGSNKSSKLASDSDKWESAKWSGGGLIEGGKGSGSSKSSKPAGGTGDVLAGKGSSPITLSDRESGIWSGGGAL